MVDDEELLERSDKWKCVKASSGRRTRRYIIGFCADGSERRTTRDGRFLLSRAVRDFWMLNIS